MAAEETLNSLILKLTPFSPFSRLTIRSYRLLATCLTTLRQAACLITKAEQGSSHQIPAVVHEVAINCLFPCIVPR